jgi:hypothetical protein
VDRINKPDRPLPSGRVTPGGAYRMYSAISLIATTACGWLLPRPVAAVIVVWQLALAVYARWAKPRFIVNNLMVAAISSSSFLAGAMLAHNARAAIIPVAIAFVFVLCREIVKGVEDVIGDRKGGVLTLAVALGAEEAGTVGGRSDARARRRVAVAGADRALSRALSADHGACRRAIALERRDARCECQRATSVHAHQPPAQAGDVSRNCGDLARRLITRSFRGRTGSRRR